MPTEKTPVVWDEETKKHRPLGQGEKMGGMEASIVSSDAGNLIRQGSDGLAYASGSGMADPRADNLIETSAQGRLQVTPARIAEWLDGHPQDAALVAEALRVVSGDSGNMLSSGSDGGAFLSGADLAAAVEALSGDQKDALAEALAPVLADGETIEAENGKLKVSGVSGAEVTASGSTEPRSLADRFAGMVNVLDFGAKANGLDNDYPAFAAAAAAAGDRFVYIPSGSYYLSRKPEGLYFSDGRVDTGGVEIALTDFGDVRGSEYLDQLNFGLIGHFRRKPEWPDNADNYVGQGMASDGETYLYVAQHHENESQYIIKYDVPNRRIASRTKYTTLGHVNCMDYKDGRLYVATMDANSRVAVINPQTMAIESYVTPVSPVSSIAWDYTRGCWWATSGTVIKRFSADMSAVEETFTVPFAEGESAGQGVTCYEGMLYFPRYRDDEGTERQRGHVAYVFDPLVGRVVHRWDIAYGISEIEDFCFYKGYLVTTAAASSAYNYYIYGAQFKKGLHTTFGPLPGENKQFPYVRPLHGTDQQMKLYVDASAVSQGVGTAASPFNNIESAFIVMNMVPHSSTVFYVKGDCTEGGYQDKLLFQSLAAFAIFGWDENPDVCVIPGFGIWRTQYFRLLGVTVRPYYRAYGRSGADDAIYMTGTSAYIGNVKWDTSQYPGTLEGLLYASGACDVAIASMDFSGVSAAKMNDSFLVRITDGSRLHLLSTADRYTVPAALSSFRVFDCKGLCDSYYGGLGSLVYKDNTIYVQNVVAHAAETVVPNS